MSFHFGKWTAAELRFHQYRYRAGGPWLNRYVVHDAPHRYGVSFRTAKGWQFFGVILLRNLDALGTELHRVSSEVRDLSDRVTNIEPTWKDYLRKQDQVRGAGTLGRAIWKAGGWLLAAAVALVGFYAWVTSHMTFRP